MLTSQRRWLTNRGKEENNKKTSQKGREYHCISVLVGASRWQEIICVNISSHWLIERRSQKTGERSFLGSLGDLHALLTYSDKVSFGALHRLSIFSSTIAEWIFPTFTVNVWQWHLIARAFHSNQSIPRQGHCQRANDKLFFSRTVLRHHRFDFIAMDSINGSFWKLFKTSTKNRGERRMNVLAFDVDK